MVTSKKADYSLMQTIFRPLLEQNRTILMRNAFSQNQPEKLNSKQLSDLIPVECRHFRLRMITLFLQLISTIKSKWEILSLHKWIKMYYNVN